jgi:Domain of unknown function (DUF4338)
MGQQSGVRARRVPSRKALRKLVLESLEQQGWTINGARPEPPSITTKAELRALHAPSVAHRLERAEPELRCYEERLLTCIASGDEVDPSRIDPVIVPVVRGSHEERLFRYASLHWSIPVSSGYGRRLRFLVMDRQNDRLIGLIGLGDPVFNVGVRDRWIGWDMEARRQRLQQVMDAFVIGAVPPYSQLLMGKFVGMLLTSREVHRAFSDKYSEQTSRISKRQLANRLALITTTSALGRSSIYNRLRFRGLPLFISAGFTEGYGEFHFTNGVYGAMSRYAEAVCFPTERNPLWGGGQGFRNRREVIRKSLMSLGLTSELVYHGIRREFFLIPSASNTFEYLRGDHQRLRPTSHWSSQLFAEFRERWLLPRAERDERYRDFDRESFRLWD